MQSWIFMQAPRRLSPPGPGKSCVSLTLIILTCWQRATRQRNKETAKSGSALKFTTNFPTLGGKRARKKDTLLHTLAVVADALSKNPAHLTGGRSSLSDWLGHIVLTRQAEVRSAFRLRGFKMEWRQMCFHRTVIYQRLSLRQSMTSAHYYVMRIHLQGHAWRRPSAIPHNGIEMLYKTCVCMCVWVNHTWYGYICPVFTVTGKHGASCLWCNWRSVPGFLLAEIWLSFSTFTDCSLVKAESVELTSALIFSQPLFCSHAAGNTANLLNTTFI